MIIQSYNLISKVIVFFFKTQFEELKTHQIKKKPIHIRKAKPTPSPNSLHEYVCPS